jgi:hypothetical protein
MSAGVSTIPREGPVERVRSALRGPLAVPVPTVSERRAVGSEPGNERPECQVGCRRRAVEAHGDVVATP